MEGTDFAAWFISSEDTQPHPCHKILKGEQFILITKSPDSSKNPTFEEKIVSTEIIECLKSGAAQTSLRSEERLTEMRLVRTRGKILPLDKDDARMILSNENLNPSTIPIVIFINGGYMGVKRGTDVMEIFDFTTEQLVRKSFNNYSEKSNALFDIRNLPIENHSDVKSVDFTYTYDILSQDILAEESCSLCMTCSWNQRGELLSPDLFPSNPPLSSAIELYIRSVHPSIDTENNSSIIPFYRELEALTRLNMIRNSVRLASEWTGHKYKEPAVSSVNAFLDEISSEGYTVEQKLSNGVGDLGSRPDADFTDKLWTFCCRTIDQADFIEVMNATVQRLESGELQPLVSKNNLSQLANLIRECLKISNLRSNPEYESLKASLSSQFDFWLEDRSPEPCAALELLVEIGVEKLKKEMCHWFTEHNLISWNRLKSYFDTESKTKQVHRLNALLRVAELWQLVKNNVLCLPREQFRILVQQSFDYWSSKTFQDKSSELELKATTIYRLIIPRFAVDTSKLISSIAEDANANIYRAKIHRNTSQSLFIELFDYEGNLDPFTDAGFEKLYDEIEDVEHIKISGEDQITYRLGIGQIDTISV